MKVTDRKSPLRLMRRLIFIIWSRLSRLPLLFRFRWQVLFSGTSVQNDSSLLIEHPVTIHGIGSLVIGKHVWLGFKLANNGLPPILLQPRTANAVISIGDSSAIMNGTEIIAQMAVTIGPRCLIGPSVSFMDSDFHGIAPDQRGAIGAMAPIVLEENVWVGSRAVIVKGVTIGRDAIVGACAVVTKNVPAGAIVAGNPARVVGSVYSLRVSKEFDSDCYQAGNSNI
ncbi:MAG: acyltransferase [bacterium]